MGDNFQHFLLVHMLLQTRELHNRRPWVLLFNRAGQIVQGLRKMATVPETSSGPEKNHMERQSDTTNDATSTGHNVENRSDTQHDETQMLLQ